MDISVCSSLCDVILVAAKKSSLKKAVFSKPADKNIIKAVLTPVLIGGKPYLQAEYFHKDNKATHKNIALSDSALTPLLEMTEAFSQVNVITPVGECEYKVSSKGTAVLLGGTKLVSKLEASDATVAATTNNKEKNHILPIRAFPSVRLCFAKTEMFLRDAISKIRVIPQQTVPSARQSSRRFPRVKRSLKKW